MPVPGHSQRYNAAHRQARAQFVAAYIPGASLCALCGRPMSDWPSALDLAHDESGWSYLGLAHRRCNRGYGQAETNAAVTRYVPRAGSDDHLLHTGPVPDDYHAPVLPTGAEEWHRAALTVAAHTRDAEDCALLLLALGLLGPAIDD